LVKVLAGVAKGVRVSINGLALIAEGIVLVGGAKSAISANPLHYIATIIEQIKELLIVNLLAD